jgi:predicted lipopolysaccharide heptosyltransferase III
MYYKIINKKKKVITIIADLLGYALWAPINIFSDKKNIPPKDIKEILVIRASYIGDVIMTLPILKPLKKKYPNTKITFLTSARAVEVLNNNPYIDDILTYDAFWFYPKELKRAITDYWKFLRIYRFKSYDLVIDARGDLRDIILLAYLSKSKYRVSYNVGGGGYLLTHVVPFNEIKHKVEYHLDIVRFLGCESNPVDWSIYLKPEEKNSGRMLLLKEGVGESDFIVGIHPGGRLGLKCWFDHGYAQVADWIATRTGAKIVFTGSEGERALIENIIVKMGNPAINLSGKINLRLLASLIERFNLFICNDSAPLHIASVMKTPTVAIFGPSKSIETGPYSNLHRVVEKNFPCRYQCDENSCHHERLHACMKDITVEDVLGAVTSLIEEVSKPKPYMYKAVNEIRADQEGN